MQTTLKFLFHVISFVRDFWGQLDKRELSTSDERVSQNCDYVSLITDLSVYLSSRWQRTAFIYFQKSSAWVRRRYCLPPNYITMECLGPKSSLEQFHLYNLIMIFSKRQTANKWCHVLYFKMKRKECVWLINCQVCDKPPLINGI